jgi:hypothetical protein
MGGLIAKERSLPTFESLATLAASVLRLNFIYSTFLSPLTVMSLLGVKVSVLLPR